MKKFWINGLYNSWISDLLCHSGLRLHELGVHVKSFIEDQRTHQNMRRYHIRALRSMYECTGMLLERHTTLE